MNRPNLKWLYEQIPTVPNHPKLYRFICFVAGKRKSKLTYREWYILLRLLNEKQEDGEIFAFKQTIELYKQNNKRYPDGCDDE